MRALVRGVALKTYGWATILPRGPAGHLGALLVFLAATAVLFWGALFQGSVYYERDTYVFYYPLSQWFDEQLAQGTFPLWLPLIYAGYAILADGEIGMLYPIKLLLVVLLAPESAFIWDKALHFFLAGSFAYVLGRVLGLRWTGGVLVGLVFAFGSFLIGQLHHDNVVRTAVWAPLVLAFAELAIRRRGRKRVLYVIAGGGALGMAGLGLHPQPLLLENIALWAYVGWRTLVGPYRCPSMVPSGPGNGCLPPSGQGDRGNRPALQALFVWVGRAGVAYGRSLPWRVGALVVIAGGIILLGLSLAACQIVAQYSLGVNTLRGSGASYAFASSYAVPHFQLLGLLFPYFFRMPSGQSWSLWTYWESTVYIGIAPLLLACYAVVKVRGRRTAFFALLAAASLVLAMAYYSPIDLYAAIWNLPGFSFLRAPGRFSMVFVLAMAVLAGHGADALARGRAVTAGAGSNGAGEPRRRWPGTVLLAAAVLAPAALAGAMVAMRRVAQADQASVLKLIDALYLSQRHDDYTLAARTVFDGLMVSLDPWNPRTFLSLALLAGSLVLCGLWRASTYLRPAWRRWATTVLPVLLVTLVAGDLLAFATAFHPRGSLQSLQAPSDGMRFLKAVNGLHRVFVEPSLNVRWGANRLVPFGLDVVSGYSSLEPRRHNEYLGSLWRDDNILLDLMNVKYVVVPAKQDSMPSYEGTLFHPVHTLLTGPAENPTGQEEFRVPRMQVGLVRVVAALTQAEDIPNGTVVGELALQDSRGTVRTLPLRAGMDLAESGYDRPEVRGRVKHGRASIAFTGTGFTPDGKRQIVNLYSGAYTISPPMEVEKVSVRYTYPEGVLQVHGLGLYQPGSSTAYSVTFTDRAKYREVYRDSEVVILENRDAFPRAYVVPQKMWHTGNVPALVRLALQPFDPRSCALLEGDSPSPQEQQDHPVPDGAQVGGPSAAGIDEYSPNYVRVRTRAPWPGTLVLADRYDPGWKAWVDGQEVPVRRANSVFRGVEVSAGEHVVEFRYDPWPVKVGLAISAAAALAMVAGTVVLLRKGTE